MTDLALRRGIVPAVYAHKLGLAGDPERRGTTNPVPFSACRTADRAKPQRHGHDRRGRNLRAQRAQVPVKRLQNAAGDRRGHRDQHGRHTDLHAVGETQQKVVRFR